MLVKGATEDGICFPIDPLVIRLFVNCIYQGDPHNKNVTRGLNDVSYMT